MRVGKSVSLDAKIWIALENYRKRNGLPSISSALEEILRRKLKEMGELK